LLAVDNDAEARRQLTFPDQNRKRGRSLECLFGLHEGRHEPLRRPVELAPWNCQLIEQCVGIGTHDAMLRLVLGFVGMSLHGEQKQCRNTVDLDQRCQRIDDVSQSGILEGNDASSPRQCRADGK